MQINSSLVDIKRYYNTYKHEFFRNTGHSFKIEVTKPNIKLYLYVYFKFLCSYYKDIINNNKFIHTHTDKVLKITCYLHKKKETGQ